MRSKESLILHELFCVIIPRYFSEGEEHLYLELMEDTLASHPFQVEKERIDKQYLLYKSIDKCFFCLMDFIRRSKKSEAQRSQDKANKSDCFSAHRTSVFVQNLNILTLIWQNNSDLFQQSVQGFQTQFSKFMK